MGNVGASQMLIEVRVGLKSTFAATLDTVSDSLAKAFRYLQMRGVSRLWTLGAGTINLHPGVKMGSAAALAIGGLTGGLTAINSFAASRLQAAQQKAQGQALQAQANVTRQQAAITAEKGRIEAENFDRQKSALRREYEDIQGRNRSLLAAGNVDMGSGSALSTSIGNMERFAADVGENAYQKALKEWETAQEVKNLTYQADMYDAQGSFLKKSAGNLGASLLSAGLIQVFSWVWPLTAPLTDQLMLELFFAVILPALGAAILFNIDASSGGTDIAAVGISFILTAWCISAATVAAMIPRERK